MHAHTVHVEWAFRTVLYVVSERVVPYVKQASNAFSRNSCMLHYLALIKINTSSAWKCICNRPRCMPPVSTCGNPHEFLTCVSGCHDSVTLRISQSLCIMHVSADKETKQDALLRQNHALLGGNNFCPHRRPEKLDTHSTDYV